MKNEDKEIFPHNSPYIRIHFRAKNTDVIDFAKKDSSTHFLTLETSSKTNILLFERFRIILPPFLNSNNCRKDAMPIPTPMLLFI